LTSALGHNDRINFPSSVFAGIESGMPIALASPRKRRAEVLIISPSSVRRLSYLNKSSTFLDESSKKYEGPR
jgi:hypothetical protein